MHIKLFQLNTPHPTDSHLQDMIEKTIFQNQLGIAITYWIGQDAQDNFDILDQAYPDDLWFHVYNAPSCHVIAHLPVKIDRKDLRWIKTQGAVLCRDKTKTKTKPQIMCAKVKDVSKTDRVGQVHVQNFSLI